MIGLVEKKREELTLTITERERKHMIGRKKWDTYVCVCVYIYINFERISVAVVSVDAWV